MKHTKLLMITGIIASIFGIILFLANLDQARLNMQGEKGSIILSVALLINCICRTIYGWLQRDKAIWITNGIGVITSIIVIFTYFYF